MTDKASIFFPEFQSLQETKNLLFLSDPKYQLYLIFYGKRKKAQTFACAFLFVMNTNLFPNLHRESVSDFLQFEKRLFVNLTTLNDGNHFEVPTSFSLYDVSNFDFLSIHVEDEWLEVFFVQGITHRRWQVGVSWLHPFGIEQHDTILRLMLCLSPDHR